MTLNELKAVYGRRWSISASLGGGWYAVRREDLSLKSLQRGLSHVRCGQTLEELACRLAAEKRIEEQWWTAGVLDEGPGSAAGSPPKQARRRD
ncbi:hypothetical protein GCM10018952_13380 [Streptosporangium vulgare]